MQPRKPDRSEPTRERLLAAAHAVLARDGWPGASSRAIADEAGVNLALINYHFGSKSALLLAALDNAIAGLEAGAPPPRAGKPPLVEAVRAAQNIADDASARVLLAACVEATRDAELAVVVRGKLAALRAMVLEMVGGRRRDAGLATLLAATLDGLLLHRAIDPETDVEGAARALARLLRGDPGPERAG